MIAVAASSRMMTSATIVSVDFFVSFFAITPELIAGSDKKPRTSAVIFAIDIAAIAGSTIIAWACDGMRNKNTKILYTTINAFILLSYFIL